MVQWWSLALEITASKKMDKLFQEKQLNVLLMKEGHIVSYTIIKKSVEL